MKFLIALIVFLPVYCLASVPTQAIHSGGANEYEFIIAIEQGNYRAAKSLLKKLSHSRSTGLYFQAAKCDYYRYQGDLKKLEACVDSLDKSSKIRLDKNRPLYFEIYVRNAEKGTDWRHIGAWNEHFESRIHILRAALFEGQGKLKDALLSLQKAEASHQKVFARKGYQQFYESEGEINIDATDLVGYRGDPKGYLIGGIGRWQEDFFLVHLSMARIHKKLGHTFPSHIPTKLKSINSDLLIDDDDLWNLRRVAYIDILNASYGKFDHINYQQTTYFDEFNDSLESRQPLLVFEADDSYSTIAAKYTASFGLMLATPIGQAAFWGITHRDKINKDILRKMALRQDLKLKHQLVIALAAKSKGDIQSAKTALNKLLNDPFLTIMPDIAWQAHHVYAQILSKNNESDLAVMHWNLSISKLDSERKSKQIQNSDIQLIESRTLPYQHLVDELIKRGDIEEAFRVAERGKSRALMDSLINTSLRKDDQLVVRKVEKLRSRVDYFQRKNDQKKLESTLKKLTTLEADVKQNTPRLYNLLSAGDAELANIQQHLSNDETIVEYYESYSGFLAFLITANSIEIVKIDSDGLQDNVAQFRTDLIDFGSSAYRTSAHNLYLQVFSSLHDKLIHKKLVIIPHGPLHYVPFNALYDGSRFLIEDYTIRILPSASSLPVLAAPSDISDQGLLVLGNPDLGNSAYDLPAAEREAKLIASISGGLSLMRKQATETALRTQGINVSNLHIASHGEFKPHAPLESRLLLAKDARNDGNLTVEELYEMNINSDLVVLSACETGVGDITDGDDVVGLSRGFMYAGVKSIIASLWVVDDNATANMMLKFYQEKKSWSNQESLRKAQLHIFQKYKTHPYYWAAFQINGL